MKELRKLAIAVILYAIAMPVFGQKSETPKLTDPEIASVAVAANKIDINYAAIAKEKSKNADVLKFAETMANDHKSVIDQAVALVTKLKVTPKDNAVSQKLNADAEKTKKSLRAKSGDA